MIRRPLETAIRRLVGRLPRLAWLDARYGSALRAFAPALAMTALAVVLALAPTTVNFEMMSARFVDLGLREGLGRAPALDPRLKIFAFDDATLTMVGAPDLSLEDWTSVIRALDQRQPRLVIIDKIFAQVPPGEALESFLATVTASKARVMIGAFVAAAAIKGREPLDLTLPAFAAENFLATGSARRPTGGFPYGPMPKVAAALGTATRIGHVNLDEGGARRPFFAFEGGRILPSLPLLAAQSLRFDGPDAVRADDVVVPIDHLGRVPSGFASPEAVAKRAYSMRALIQRARAKQDVPVVDAGDVVVLLPQMFTGNTDFFDSPFGRQAGGNFLVSDINDVMSGRHPRPLPYRGPIVFFCGALGLWLGARVRLGRALLAVGAATILVALVGTFGFALADVISPWLPGALATSCSGALLYHERQRLETLRRVHVDAALETASALQMITIPPPTFLSPTLKIAAAYIPADECAGDWWHHFDLEGVRYVIVADATGHGVSAALISTASRAALESLSVAGERLDPIAILKRMGQVLYGMGHDKLSTCACVAAIDLARGRATIANAGLCFPLLVPSDKGDARLMPEAKRRGVAKAGVHTIRAAGTPLGLFAEQDLASLEVDLRSGDRLVIFSDGLTEANDPHGNQWGQIALAQALDVVRTQSAPTILKGVLGALDRYRKEEPFADDVTVVVVEVL